jgi:hypothetical protein
MSASNNDSKKNPLKYAAIIGSLAVLAVILSPVSPFAQQSNNPLSNSAGTIEEPPQPENISEVDVLECTSLIQGVEYLIAGGRLEPIEDEEFTEEGEELPAPVFNLTSEEKLASDTLLGEFCNRPELVQNMSAAYDPTVNLVAYGCDAASGKLGDAALQDSISDYQEIYCSSAVETVEFELVSWSDSIDLFSGEIIPAARETHSGNETATALLDEAESVLVNASQSIAEAQELLVSDSVFESARALDRGISTFTALVEREDMAFLLDI